MKKIVGIWVIWALGAVMVGGCAGNTVVKKDETGTTLSAVTQTNQTSNNAAANVSTATAAPIVETPAASAATMSNSASQSNGQLKSALEKVYFDFNSYDLSEQARRTLTANADYLRKNAVIKVRIEGNCDERGSAEYNIALGEKRAKAAVKYLVTLGVPEDNLSIISYGKEKPADPGHDEPAWAKNRRDDFTVISK